MWYSIKLLDNLRISISIIGINLYGSNTAMKTIFVIEFRNLSGQYIPLEYIMVLQVEFWD